MRTVAIIAVIIIDTAPFADRPGNVDNHLDGATIVNQLARFAIPFFLVVSGYFWRINFKLPKRYARPPSRLQNVYSSCCLHGQIFRLR
jgi:surface polysaccharide O-acyltransferase-like enzyme